MYFDNKNFPGHESKIYGKELKWFPADILKNYDINNNEYSAKDISYKFNSHGFRCDEFIKTDGIRIVFLGCSVTEGIAVRQEEIWATKFLQKIEKKYNFKIPYWNLSLGGCGIDSILRAYYHYCDILKPHLLIAYFPEYRKEFYDRKINTFNVYNVNDHYKPKEFFEEKFIKYETNKNFLFFKLLAQKYKSQFFWNTYGNIEFYNEKPTFLSQINWDRKGRDKLHPGRDSHNKFAEDVWKELENKINF